MKDIEHLVRMAVVFAVGLIAFLVIRHFLVPVSFGRIGHYRAAALDDIKAYPVHYGGRKACVSCHAKQGKTLARSRHQGSSCETCHGALLAHELDPKALKPGKPGAGDIRAFCEICHAQNPSKPKAFPQIHDAAHNPGLPCIGCHDPHNPKL